MTTGTQDRVEGHNNVCGSNHECKTFVSIISAFMAVYRIKTGLTGNENQRFNTKSLESS